MRKVIILYGVAGTGKSTIAERLHEDLGLNILRTYTTRERRPMESEINHVFADIDYKREDNEARILKYNNHGKEYWSYLSDFKNSDLAILDANSAAEIKRTLKGDCIVIKLTADSILLTERVVKRNQSTKEEAVQVLREEFLSEDWVEFISDYTIDTGLLNVEETLDFLKKLIKSNEK